MELSRPQGSGILDARYYFQSPHPPPHDPSTTHHQALQQYEEEQEAVRKQGYARNPLVRDQATLIIDKVGCGVWVEAGDHLWCG